MDILYEFSDAIAMNFTLFSMSDKLCSYCLFPVIDKSGTSCYLLVTSYKGLMRPTD
jgi:hypothetical protein